MPLLATRYLPKLLLWYPGSKSLQPAQDLGYTLDIQYLLFGSSNQGFNLRHTVTNQMLPKTRINLLHHQSQELLVFPLSTVEDLVHKSTCQQLICRYPLAHNESFVRLANSHSLHECSRCATLSYETETRERSEDKGVWRCIYEVGESGQGRGQANRRTIESRDEYLGVCVEGIGDFKVVGREVFQPVSMQVRAGRLIARESYIGSAA